MMRESSGHSSRLSSRIKAALVALVAVFAIGAVATTSATAAQQLNLQFSDGWIRVPALDALGDPGSGTFHALDPASENPPTVSLSGSLANDGSFSSPASAFDFPTQVIDGGALGNVNLEIEAAQNITGTYTKSTGQFAAQLPLTLTVRVPTLATNCRISPLNIGLTTTGSVDFLTDNGGPGVLLGVPFLSGSGNALGNWTGVTVADVTGIDGTTDATCQAIIQGLIGEADSFDGSISLSGSATVTGQPDRANISRVAIVGAKRIRAGKTLRLRVRVTNSGNVAGRARVKLKSSNRQVRVPGAVVVNVPAGRTATKVITVRASARARGRAVVTASFGRKAGRTVLTVVPKPKPRRRGRR